MLMKFLTLPVPLDLFQTGNCLADREMNTFQSRHH